MTRRTRPNASRALEEAGFQIDPMEPVENQVDDALEALRPVIPIRFEEVTMAVQLPADYAGSGQAQIREFGDLEREEWQNDGSWVGVLTFPAGLQKTTCTISSTRSRPARATLA